MVLHAHLLPWQVTVRQHAGWLQEQVLRRQCALRRQDDLQAATHEVLLLIYVIQMGQMGFEIHKCQTYSAKEHLYTNLRN